MSGAEAAEEPAEEPLEEEPDAETEVSRDIGFEFIIEKNVLESYLEAINAATTECILNIEEDGLHVTAVDSANVQMVDADLSTDAFEIYEATRTRIGVNTERFLEAIDFADKTELIHVTLNEENRKLAIQIGETQLTMAGINPDSVRNEPEIPDLGLPVEATLDAGYLKRAQKIAEFVDDTGVLHVSYSEDSGEFTFESPGDTDAGTLTVSSEDIVEAEAEGDAKSMFSVDYLQKFIPVIPDDTTVTVRLGVNHPLKVEYWTEEGALHVLNMVAPRVESE